MLLKLGRVTTTRKIMNMLAADLVGGNQAVIERARKMLAQQPVSGTNTILVAHGNLVRAATGAYPGEAGAVIFRPEEDGTITLIAEVSPEIWAELAE